MTTVPTDIGSEEYHRLFVDAQRAYEILQHVYLYLDDRIRYTKEIELTYRFVEVSYRYLAPYMQYLTVPIRGDFYGAIICAGKTWDNKIVQLIFGRHNMCLVVTPTELHVDAWKRVDESRLFAPFITNIFLPNGQKNSAMRKIFDPTRCPLFEPNRVHDAICALIEKKVKDTRARADNLDAALVELTKRKLASQTASK